MTDFSWDALQAAFYAEHRKTGGGITESRRKGIITEVSDRLDARENPLDLMEEYGDMNV